MAWAPTRSYPGSTPGMAWPPTRSYPGSTPRPRTDPGSIDPYATINFNEDLMLHSVDDDYDSDPKSGLYLRPRREEGGYKDVTKRHYPNEILYRFLFAIRYGVHWAWLTSPKAVTKLLNILARSRLAENDADTRGLVYDRVKTSPFFAEIPDEVRDRFKRRIGHYTAQKSLDERTRQRDEDLAGFTNAVLKGNTAYLTDGRDIARLAKRLASTRLEALPWELRDQMFSFLSRTPEFRRTSHYKGLIPRLRDDRALSGKHLIPLSPPHTWDGAPGPSPGSPLPFKEAATVKGCLIDPVIRDFAHAHFTHEDIERFRELFRMSKNVKRPWTENFGRAVFGIFHHLKKLPELRIRREHGYFNAVTRMRMKQLPWKQGCAEAITRDPNVMNLHVVVRRAMNPMSMYEITTEVLLTAVLANAGIAPKLYGAIIYDGTARDYAHKLEYERKEGRDWGKYSQVRLGTAEMISEAFDGDLYKLARTTSYEPYKAHIARELTSLFAKAAALNIICIDLKLTNTVYRFEDDGSLTIRLIDFGTMFSGTDFLGGVDLDKDLDTQVARRRTMFKEMGNTAEEERKMKFAFMVVIMALTTADRGDNLMRGAVRRIYDEEADLLNGVPMSQYEKWHRANILGIAGVIKLYTKKRVGKQKTMQRYIERLLTMRLK